ncbi:class I SAM-dependent methyltransferase [Rhodocyclaceae bacterium SMB388]
MHTRELGLVLAQQLLGIADLHYGWWEEGEQPTLARLREAQERYSTRLIEVVEEYCPHGGRILDVGCGTGHLMEKMLQRGFHVDVVIPAPWLEQQVRQRLTRLGPDYESVVFACEFEHMPESARDRPYDLVLFSESFQYVPLDDSLPMTLSLLAPGGKVVVCDFFKTEHHGDGGLGDRSFGGGHRLDRFYASLERYGFHLLRDDDITRFTSPSIALLDELLRNRIAPACATIDRYLSERVPMIRRLVGWLMRRRLARLRYKYLEQHRTQAVFERYKSYRLLAFEPADTASQQPVSAAAST